jgi:hypothetical protein
MGRLTICLVAILGGVHVASADDAPPVEERPFEQPLDTFLAQRATEELAAQGVALSRFDLTLSVETSIDELVVELRHNGTHELAAASRLPRVRGDREVTAARVVEVAISLVSSVTRASRDVAITIPLLRVADTVPGAERRPLEEARRRRRRTGIAMTLGGAAAMALGAMLRTDRTPERGPCFVDLHATASCMVAGGYPRASALLGDWLVIGGALTSVVGVSYTLSVGWPSRGGVVAVSGRF